MPSPTARNDTFLRACRGESTSHVPIWIMRQAGRYLPEYRALKEKHDFLSLCKTPELACEVTLQPVRRLGVDAAILFSDILIPVEPMGVGLRFDPGPILDRAVDHDAAVDALRPLDAEESCGFVLEAIRLLRQELAVPLIGFAGAPFTIAAYLAEGRLGKGSGFDRIVRMIFERPDLAHRLLAKIADATANYLSAQIRAGAEAVQLFDSWGGIVGRGAFQEFVLPYARRVIEALPRERGPVIYFVLNGGHVLDLSSTSGADVIGVDWRTSLSHARRMLARPLALQGNLDPRALHAPRQRLRELVRETLREGAPSGHVFNLGHGIQPDAPLAAAEALVELVHEESSR